MVPVSNGESISTASAMVAQESAGIHFEFFPLSNIVHRMLIGCGAASMRVHYPSPRGVRPGIAADTQPAAGSGWLALALASSAGNWPSAWAMAIASWYSRHPVICPR